MQQQNMTENMEDDMNAMSLGSPSNEDNLQTLQMLRSNPLIQAAISKLRYLRQNSGGGFIALSQVNGPLQQNGVAMPNEPGMADRGMPVATYLPPSPYLQQHAQQGLQGNSHVMDSLNFMPMHFQPDDSNHMLPNQSLLPSVLQNGLGDVVEPGPDVHSMAVEDVDHDKFLREFVEKL